MSDSYENNQVLPTFENQGRDSKRKDACPQLPGTVLRIFIPAGAVINLLNLIEVSSPSGICLIVRIPLLAGIGDRDGKDRVFSLADIQEAVKSVGGTVEVM
jgi:hypothetical protein